MSSQKPQKKVARFFKLDKAKFVRSSRGANVSEANVTKLSTATDDLYSVTNVFGSETFAPSKYVSEYYSSHVAEHAASHINTLQSHIDLTTKSLRTHVRKHHRAYARACSQTQGTDSAIAQLHQLMASLQLQLRSLHEHTLNTNAEEIISCGHNALEAAAEAEAERLSRPCGTEGLTAERVRLFCEELGARVVAKHYSDCAALVLAAVQLGLIPPMGGISTDASALPNSIAGMSVVEGGRAGAHLRHYSQGSGLAARNNNLSLQLPGYSVSPPSSPAARGGLNYALNSQSDLTGVGIVTAEGATEMSVRGMSRRAQTRATRHLLWRAEVLAEEDRKESAAKTSGMLPSSKKDKEKAGAVAGKNNASSFVTRTLRGMQDAVDATLLGQASRDNLGNSASNKVPVLCASSRVAQTLARAYGTDVHALPAPDALSDLPTGFADTCLGSDRPLPAPTSVGLEHADAAVYGLQSGYLGLGDAPLHWREVMPVSDEAVEKRSRCALTLAKRTTAPPTKDWAVEAAVERHAHPSSLAPAPVTRKDALAVQSANAHDTVSVVGSAQDGARVPLAPQLGDDDDVPVEKRVWLLAERVVSCLLAELSALAPMTAQYAHNLTLLVSLGRATAALEAHLRTCGLLLTEGLRRVQPGTDVVAYTQGLCATTFGGIHAALHVANTSVLPRRPNLASSVVAWVEGQLHALCDILEEKVVQSEDAFPRLAACLTQVLAAWGELEHEGVCVRTTIGRRLQSGLSRAIARRCGDLEVVLADTMRQEVQWSQVVVKLGARDHSMPGHDAELSMLPPLHEAHYACNSPLLLTHSCRYLYDIVGSLMPSLCPLLASPVLRICPQLDATIASAIASLLESYIAPLAQTAKAYRPPAMGIAPSQPVYSTFFALLANHMHIARDLLPRTIAQLTQASRAPSPVLLATCRRASKFYLTLWELFLRGMATVWVRGIAAALPSGNAPAHRPSFATLAPGQAVVGPDAPPPVSATSRAAPALPRREVLDYPVIMTHDAALTFALPPRPIPCLHWTDEARLTSRYSRTTPLPEMSPTTPAHAIELVSPPFLLLCRSVIQLHRALHTHMSPPAATLLTCEAALAVLKLLHEETGWRKLFPSFGGAQQLVCDISVFARLVLRLTGAESIAANARAAKVSSSSPEDVRGYVTASTAARPPVGIDGASALLGQQCELLTAHITHVCKSLGRRTVRIRAASVDRQNKLNAQAQAQAQDVVASSKPAASDDDKNSQSPAPSDAGKKAETTLIVDEGPIVLHDMYYDQVCELVLAVLEKEDRDAEQLP